MAEATPAAADVIRDLLGDLERFDQAPESRGHDLRLDLSEIILRHLSKKGWTQKRLAQEAGMKETMLTRIIHAASNCTFDTAGRILFALGIKAKLHEVREASGLPGTASPGYVDAADSTIFQIQVTTHGKTKGPRYIQEDHTSAGRSVWTDFSALKRG
jgi:hypothetical protein